jgi:hypothetical protein
MWVIEDFDQALTKVERREMAQLTTPHKIQAFLDAIPYRAEAIYRCRCASFGSGSLIALMVLYLPLRRYADWVTRP